MCHLLPSAPAAPPLGSATDWAEMVVAGKSADGELPVDIRDASWTPHYNSTATFSRLYVRGVARVWGPEVAAPDGNFPHDWGRGANIVSYILPARVLSCGTHLAYAISRPRRPQPAGPSPLLCRLWTRDRRWHQHWLL